MRGIKSNEITTEARADEDYYQLLFKSHPNPMWFYDRETLRFLAVNDAAIQHYGYSREEFLNLTITDIYPPNDIPALLEAVTDTSSGIKIDDRPWRHRKRDGTIIYVRITGHVLTFAGRPAELVLAQDVTEQQLMQERLRESEELFKGFMNTLPAVAFLKDEEGRYIYANDFAKELYKEFSDSWQGRTDYDLFPEQVARQLRRNDERVLAEGRTLEFRETLPRAGETRYWTLLKFPYRDARGRTLLAGIGFDISEQQHTERRLRHSEQLFRSVIEHAHDVITVVDRDGRILYESPAIKRMLGFTPDESIGTNAFDRFHAEDMASVRRNFEYKLQHPGEVVPFEGRLRHKDGTWRHIEGTGVNLLRDRAVRGIVVNSRDVTERKRIAAERDIERRILDALVDQLPVGVMFRNSQGHYTQVNQQVATIFGIERERILGMSANDFSQVLQARTLEGAPVRTGDDLPSGMAIREGRTVGPYEYLVTTPDGEVRHVLTTATPVKVGDELLGTVIVGNDVTEQRRVQEQLRQSQKMEAIGRLAGGVAHDFNNLLTAITGYSDLLLRRTDMDAAAHNHVEQIRRAADRAAALTQQLLAFSRKQMLQTRMFNLNETIEELESILRRLIGENIQLEMRLAPDLGYIESDQHQMEQVIINLAVNARDAMPEGGHLVIETRNADAHFETLENHRDVAASRCCLLVVRDTGHGMSEETRSHIFEPFFTTKEVGKGTGLGLSTAYGIVEQSGGHILVETAPGQGTTFKVYLPCVEGQAETTRQQTVNRFESATGTETVLLVEDEEMVRRMASEVLRLHGYTVIEAENGRRALELCRTLNRRIDLMITDVVMPEMSGAELAHAAHVARSEMRVLYMSGYTDEYIVQHGVLDEGLAFIHKPWTPATFLAKVREVLEAKGKGEGRK